MSSENEGNEGKDVPAAPSGPPAPAAAPATPAHPDAPPYAPGAGTQAGDPRAGAYGQAPGPHPGPPPSAPPGAEHWPPPPAPAGHETYDDGGASRQQNAQWEGVGGDPWGTGAQAHTHADPAAGKRRRKGGLVAAALVAALVAGGVGGGIGYWAADRNDDPTGSTTVSASQGSPDIKREPGTVSAVAAKALPSVVTLEAKGSSGDGGTGTGFVYDKEGHIVTNNHVVASAAEGGELSATFSNGKKYDAEVVGRAEGYDVAVVKLKNAPANLTPLPLGDSDKVAVGDSTIAIGAPFGLSNTVTTGIISAKNRPVASGDGSGSSTSYMSALQTDASINPGNSGGPLLNASGAVIGVNSAIQSTGGGLGGGGQAGSIGLGFAIPVNQTKNVAEQLIKTGEPVYPVIGVSVDMREDSGAGAKIMEEGSDGAEPLTPGGPADKAGLQPGDVVTKLDDTVIDSGPTLVGTIWTHKPGDTVKLTYVRDGKSTTVDVVLGQRKGD
ncbi:S1C family serine protease [Streptomyces sp. NPDC060194]|uniref:S1C family serine protease n=1 Tax=Streptomyces sp. NPDC060194 TaxID=3347069 RepID=UPI00365F50E5